MDRQVYLDWLENIRPWCISRQLWWGHQLPVWYRGDETYVGTEPPEGEGWERDPDVLDTWFSSGLWPFATLGWPEETPELEAFYPTDVLSTARDIIFLWVARMVMFGVELTGELPFTDVPIHSVVQAPDGRRMSKSLGTGIDPLDLIDGGPRPPVYAEGGEFPAYGADALRFGLLAMSSSQDVRFNEERVKQGARPREQALERVAADPAARGGRRGGRRRRRDGRGPLDRVAARAPDRERDRAARLASGSRQRRSSSTGRSGPSSATGTSSSPSRASTRTTTRASPRCSCTRSSGSSRCSHPVMPFATEEIWSLLPGERGLLATSPWPVADESRRDEQAEAALRPLHRGRGRAAQLPRRRRGEARDAAPRRCSRPRATTTCATTSPGSARFELVEAGANEEPWRRSRSRAAW